MRAVYRYEFGPTVCLDDVEVALVLSIHGIEALCGQAAARLDVRHVFDREKRAVVIDAGTDAGHDFAKLFVGFVRREISESAFTVKRIDGQAA